MKVLVGAFNQEKALVGAFFVIGKTGCGTDGALHSTSLQCAVCCAGGGGNEPDTGTMGTITACSQDTGPGIFCRLIDGLATDTCFKDCLVFSD